MFRGTEVIGVSDPSMFNSDTRPTGKGGLLKTLFNTTRMLYFSVQYLKEVLAPRTTLRSELHFIIFKDYFNPSEGINLALNHVCFHPEQSTFLRDLMLLFTTAIQFANTWYKINTHFAVKLTIASAISLCHFRVAQSQQQ